MPTKHQKVKIKIGTGWTIAQKKRIANDLIEVMVDSALEGQGIYGRQRRRFPKYSDQYHKSGTPDLHLSGEMLDRIQVLDGQTDGELTIGFRDGTKANAKADGNIRGTYGKQRANRAKARPFLGVTVDELDEVLEGYEKRKKAGV